jgi:hypothetical protein
VPARRRFSIEPHPTSPCQGEGTDPLPSFPRRGWGGSVWKATEKRLGHVARFGVCDFVFDASYVYAYISADNDNPDGMAAVPFVEKRGQYV